jgi:hypothetical protein
MPKPLVVRRTKDDRMRHGEAPGTRVVLFGLLALCGCKENLLGANGAGAAASQPAQGALDPPTESKGAATAVEGAGATEAVASRPAQEKTQFLAQDLQEVKDAFAKYLKTPNETTRTAYETAIRSNYVLEVDMVQHADYYVAYADEIIEHLKRLPALGKSPSLSYYFDYLVEDLLDLKNDEAAERSELLAEVLKRSRSRPEP